MSDACRGVRTLTAELSLSGRAAGERVRGTIHAGFARPDSMRLELVVGFGAPGFILAANPDEATLLLPREERYVEGARADEILGALTGVSLGPSELQAFVTGCVEPDPVAVAGRLHEGGWASIDLEGGATLYLQREPQGWVLRAARRDPWEIEYTEWPETSRFPGRLRLRSGMPVEVNVTAGVSQVETNIDLPPEAFTVEVGEASPATLDQLREAGPLRER